jgi:hypothetical protein
VKVTFDRFMLMVCACSGWRRVSIAQILVFVLIASPLSAPAQITISCAGLGGQALINCLLQRNPNTSGANNSGAESGGKTTAIIALAATAAAGLLIFLVVKKNSRTPKVKLDSPSVKFNHIVSGEPTTGTVPVRNIMSEPVTLKAITMDGRSGVLTLGDPRRTPFTLAPGEKFDIPVMLSADKGRGKARLRILASTAKTKKDAVKLVAISYNHEKSKHKNLRR